MTADVQREMAGALTGSREAAIATVEYSRQTHVEWASYLRRNPSYEPGAIGDAEYHEQAVRDYDNVPTVLTAEEAGR